MVSGKAGRARQAQSLFQGISANYDRPAQLFALLQYNRWHRQLVSQVAPSSPSLVLDMCTGTGAVVAEIVRQTGARVVGADLTRSMLLEADKRRNLDFRFFAAVQADAQSPPFTGGSFDAVVFSFLLRYVENVPATLGELAHVLRPGGRMASLEFGVPGGPWRLPWLLHTRAVLPLGLRLLSPGWGRVGSFLGPSISDFYRRWPLEAVEEEWHSAGFREVRSTRLSLGGAVITSGTLA